MTIKINNVVVQRAQDYHFVMDPICGLQDDKTTIYFKPGYAFRCELLVADDTAAGFGTQIVGIFVGNKSQRPPNIGPTPTAAYGRNRLGSGVKYDICEKDQTIRLELKFLKTCEWSGTFFGKALILDSQPPLPKGRGLKERHAKSI